MSDKQFFNNSIAKAQKCTIQDFQREFPDDDACLEYVKELRYPGGMAMCPKCKVERKHYRVSGRPVYACDHCGRQISPLAGTIFHKSCTPLSLWFHAMFQMGSTKCGISAKQIQRETGVTYKTAWRMFKQIRSLMSEDGEIKLEGSTVEMDETYYGGVCKYGAGRHGRVNKTPVVGIVERGEGGRVVARAAENLRSSTLLGMVREYVLPSTTIYTDEARTYDGIKLLRERGGKSRGKSLGYVHHRIHHSSRVYVRGNVHTNTIEGFWSLIKRGIGGTHHSVSEKFLQSYLDEYAFRYNRRNVPRPMVKQILERVCERRAS
jgi:transposase-like protein